MNKQKTKKKGNKRCNAENAEWSNNSKPMVNIMRPFVEECAIWVMNECCNGITKTNNKQTKVIAITTKLSKQTKKKKTNRRISSIIFQITFIPTMSEPSKYLYKSPYEGSFRPSKTPNIEIKPQRETVAIGRDGNIITGDNDDAKKQKFEFRFLSL